MPVSRRRFLASAGAAAGLGSLLAACDGGPARAAECAGYAGLGVRALKARQVLGYVDETPDPAQQCRRCRSYRAPASGSPCGGCRQLAGPVAPGGYCASWAAGASRGR